MTNPDIDYGHGLEVSFLDANLENVVRKEIDKYEGPIYQSKLEELPACLLGER